MSAAPWWASENAWKKIAIWVTGRRSSAKRLSHPSSREMSETIDPDFLG